MIGKYIHVNKYYVSIGRTMVQGIHSGPAKVYNKRFRSFFLPPSPSLPPHPTRPASTVEQPSQHCTLKISSICCTYSLPLRCTTLPPPRGDHSRLLRQSSNKLRRPERPRQKARYAPSRAAILAESAARYVTRLFLSLSPLLLTRFRLLSSYYYYYHPTSLPRRFFFLLLPPL